MVDYNLTEPPQAEESNGVWQHLCEHILELYDKFSKSEYRNKMIDMIKESYEAYDQVEKPQNDPWPDSASYQVPLTTISVDNLNPRLVAGLVGKKPYIHLEPENGQKQDEQTEILEEWINQELEDVVKIERVSADIIETVTLEGTVYPMPYYDADEVTRKEFVFYEDVMRELAPRIQAMQQQAQQLAPVDPAGAEQLMVGAKIIEPQQIGGVVIGDGGEPITQDVVDTVFEGGKVELIPFKDIFIADDVDDWESSPVIRRIRYKYADLMRKSDTMDGFEVDGKHVVGPWMCAIKSGTSLDRENQSPSQESDSVKETGNEIVELLECSLHYVYQDKDQEDKDVRDYTEERLLVWVEPINRVIIRILPLRDVNYKNQHLVKRVRMFPKKGKSYGVPVYGKLKSIQNGINKTFNTALNITDITMIPFYFFDKRAGMEKIREKDGYKLKPGMGIPVDDVSGIMFPRFSINPSQMFAWIDMWNMFWERLMSIGDLQVGRSGSKDTTATETMAVIQEGNIKHNYQSSSIKDEFLAVIRTIYDLYYQHMSLGKTFLWNGKQVPIPRSAMRRPFKFKLTGSTDLSNKLIERQEKEGFYRITAADPNINPVKRAEELVKSYNHTDTTEWVSPGIKTIVDQIMQTPGAMQLVQSALAEAQQVATAIQGGGR